MAPVVATRRRRAQKNSRECVHRLYVNDDGETTAHSAFITAARALLPIYKN
jgi:hypothetical protein